MTRNTTTRRITRGGGASPRARVLMEPCERRQMLAAAVAGTAGPAFRAATADPGRAVLAAVVVRSDGTVAAAGAHRAVPLAQPIGADAFPGSVRGVALGSGGDVFVAGTSGGNLAVQRVLPDGSADDSFSGDGVAHVDFGTSTDAAWQAVPQPGGGVLLVGTAGAGAARTLVAARLTAAGQLDTTFANNGKLTAALPGTSGPSALVVRGDGSLLGVRVPASATASDDPVVAGYDAGGDPDASVRLGPDTASGVSPDGGESGGGEGDDPPPAPRVTVAGTGAASVGSPYSVTFAAADLPAGVLVRGWDVDWGDGTFATSLAATATGATHTYAGAPDHPVTVTARLNSLTAAAGQAVQLGPGDGGAWGTAVAGVFAVDAAALVDVGGNALVVRAGAVAGTNDARSAVEPLVAAGFNGGLPDPDAGIVAGAPGGTGLVLGVSTAALSGLTSFGGVTIAGGDALVRPTFPGDANLDGQVDTTDLGVITDGFGLLLDAASDPLWASGDVNYDGSVDTTDLGLGLDHFGGLADDPGTGAVAVDVLAGGEPSLAGTLDGDAAVATGSPYTLTLTAGGPWAADATSWAIDWNDGGEPQVVTPGASGSTVVTHTFAPGVATPVVTATITGPGGTFDAGEPLAVAVTGVTAPGTPASVTAAPHGRNQIDVSWSDPGGTARQFDVERSDDGGATWQHVTTVNRGTTSYADTGLTPSTSHRYRVFASNDAGTSGTATAASPVTTPSGLPTGLTHGTPPAGIGAQPGDLWLTWGSAGADVTGYEVEVKHDTDDGPDQDANFHTLATASASAGGYLVTGLEPGQSYDFRVRSDFADGTVSEYIAHSVTGPTTQPSAGDQTLTAPTLTATDPPASFPVGVGFTVSQPSTQSADVIVYAQWTNRPGFLAGAGFDFWQEVGGFTPTTMAGTHSAELNPGWDYILQGQARSADADHHTSPYATITATGQGTQVPTPTDVSATVASDGGIDVTWDDGSSGGDDAATGFTVRGGDTTGLATGKHYVSASAPAGTSGSVHFAPADLLPGSKYQFAVFAEGDSDVPNFGWLSPPALSAIVTTAPAPATAPAAPAWVKAKADTHDASDKPADNEVTLTWANTPKDELGYTVYRKDPDANDDGQADDPATWNAVKTVGADVTTWTDTGMEPGDYDYKVVAFNAGGYSNTLPDADPASTAPGTSAGVWPSGYLVVFDGTWDFPNKDMYRRKSDDPDSPDYDKALGDPTQNVWPLPAGVPGLWLREGPRTGDFYGSTVARRFHEFYHPGVGTKEYQLGIGARVESETEFGHLAQGGLALEAWSKIDVQLELLTKFYTNRELGAWRREHVPIDIAGISRGAFQAVKFANLLRKVGIHDPNSKHVEPAMDGIGIGNVVYDHITDLKIRFVGLVSPVAEMPPIGPLSSLLSLGNVELVPGWDTSLPTGVQHFAQFLDNQPNRWDRKETEIDANGAEYDGGHRLPYNHGAVGTVRETMRKLLAAARRVNVPVGVMPQSIPLPARNG